MPITLYISEIKLIFTQFLFIRMKMSSNYFFVLFIIVGIFIAWNDVGAQTKTHGAQSSGVKDGRHIAQKRFQTFLRNFFRTRCYINEEESECQRMEHGTCWDRDGLDSSYPCRYGCDCKNGYLRNSRGYCVLEKHCDINHKPIDFIAPLTIHMNKILTQRKTPPGIRP